MSEFFKDYEKFRVDGASVDFYKKQDKECLIIAFDTSKCVPPEPMVNALVALNLVTNNKTKIVMINHRYPVGLIPKIKDSFDITQSEMENGLVKVEFVLKQGASAVKFDTSDVAH